MTAQGRHPSVFTSLGRCCPMRNGQVQTASRWRLPSSFAHLSPTLPSSPPLWAPRAFTTPAAAWGPYCLRTRGKKQYKTHKEWKRSWGLVGTSRFPLQRMQQEAFVLAERGQDCLLGKVCWDLRPHPPETSILCPCDTEATDTPEQDGASQESGWGTRDNTGAGRPAQEGNLLSLYSKKPASLHTEATTGRGTKLNESQCWLGGGAGGEGCPCG